MRELQAPLSPELRTVNVTRYITPLREGGSLPALAEADDGIKYVLKFIGNGHGPKALIAELIGGEVARALGLRMPELVFAELASVARKVMKRSKNCYRRAKASTSGCTTSAAPSPSIR